MGRIEKEAFCSMPLLLDLFLTFAKIGAFTFGGGYAMLSVISDHCVEKKKWITAEDMMNITVIAETTPGPVSVNCATFTGYRQKGVLGAAVATAGLVLPSFIVIFLISLFLDKFLEYPIVANAFYGVKIGVGFLVLDAALGMMKKLPKDTMTRVMLWVACGVILVTDLLSVHFSTIALMIICATISIALYVGKRQKGGAAA
jgi:chromate transporter